MYVAGSKMSPSTIAILIRGTNFFSLQDWAGNLVIEPHLWTYGATGEDIKVSSSVWLGLKILQTLKSEPFVDLAPESPVEKIEADVALDQARFEYAILKQILSKAMPYDALGLLGGIIGRLPHISNAPGGFVDEISLLEGAKGAQPNSPGSTSLLDFLKDFVSKAGEPVNIHIVGHSKGGALAAAVALWLADTQGEVAGPDAWDPDSRARLQVDTFAAPTPGNGGFANQFQQKINGAYRLANPQDIVPHVWDSVEIRQIPDLYENQLHDLRIE
jgi:hypothetical protein